MILSLQNLTLGYKKDKPLVRDINIKASGGDFIALVGRNGTGKSTLLRSLAGLAHPAAGNILLDGRSLFEMRPTQRAQHISFVSTENIRVAHLRVWDIVALGRAPYSSWSGALSDDDNAIVAKSIEEVGMSTFTDINVDRLSDGERGRVMIARAIAQQSDIILLDEPTAFLDLPNRYHIMELLKSLAHNANKLVILSTHELGMAQELADQLWVIAGESIECGTPLQMENSTALRSIMRI